MRELTSHKVNGCNEALTIEAADERGSGGANHVYCVSWPVVRGGEMVDGGEVWLRFQNGPIREAGVNGITHEALLAILIDRLEGFQSGPYACDDNALALAHVREAQATLKARTEKRLARGVEGTHTV